MRTSTFLSLSLITCLVLSACSGGPSRNPDWPEAKPVTGTVTKDGKTVANSLVTFSPVDKSAGFMARGMTNDAGEFTLRTSFAPSFDDEGAAPGEYKVLIAEPIQRESGGIENETSQADFDIQYNEEMSSKDAAVERVIPISYSNPATTPLTATVAEDGGTFDFNISK